MLKPPFPSFSRKVTRSVQNQPDIIQLAQRIRTKQDFLRFMALLAADCAAETEQWENATLSAYLEGFRGFAQDTPDPILRDGAGVECLSWRRLAEMLLAARVYE